MAWSESLAQRDANSAVDEPDVIGGLFELQVGDCRSRCPREAIGPRFEMLQLHRELDRSIRRCTARNDLVCDRPIVGAYQGAPCVRAFKLVRGERETDTFVSPVAAEKIPQLEAALGPV